MKKPMLSSLKSKLGNLVRRLAWSQGYDIVPRSRNTRVEDFIHQAFGAAQNVTFLQVGAHDGSRNDPLSLFRQNRSWRGILLEPNPTVFDRLKKNLVGYPDQKPLNIALAERSGSLPFYIVSKPESALWPLWADQISSFNRGHVENMMISLGQSQAEAKNMVHEIQVQTKSFDELLNMLPGRLDFLIIDAEGADFRLLRTFPFFRQKPALIVFEYVHLPESEMAEVFDFLTSRGYSAVKVGWDVVAVLWK